MNTENFPLEAQSFVEIIDGNLVYVDKTHLVYKLVSSHDYYFLSGPNGFEKNLLLSILKAYFEGRKKYFKGLKIETLEKDWKEYPVLIFDLSSVSFQNPEGVPNYLSSLLVEYEIKYSISQRYNQCNCVKDFVIRFRRLIKSLYEEIGREVVILIDEYEKPILDAIENPELQKDHSDYLQPFYGILKTMEEYIRFVLISGVTPKDQLSVLSDLNNLRDISQDSELASLYDSLRKR